MPTPPKTISTILAIAPGARYLGFSVFERSELVRFGVRTFTKKKDTSQLPMQVWALLEELSRRHRPTLLVIKDIMYREAQTSTALHQVIAVIKKWGKDHKIKTKSYLPTAVKAHFCTGKKKTRAALAEAMARRYWFLYSYLKVDRTQHYWRQMFDAVGLGAFAAEDQASHGKPRSPALDGFVAKAKTSAIPLT